MTEYTLSAVLTFGALGLFGGIISATFGIGSGVLVIPFLTIFAAMPQKDAQGISLAVMVPMALMGALRYHWNPDIHIDWRIVSVLAVTVVIGANIGATVVGHISNRNLQLGFGIFLLVVASRFIFTALKSGT